MAGEEMSPMAFQTRLIEYYNSRGEVDVEERVESLKQAILAYNNPKMFKEVLTIIVHNDIKLHELVSEKCIINVINLREVVKLAEKAVNSSNNLFFDEMIENQTQKNQELKNKIAALILTKEMMSQDDWKFVEKNAREVFANMTDEQWDQFFEGTAKGKNKDAIDRLKEISKILKRNEEELAEEDLFISVKTKRIVGDREEDVIKKVKVTSDELKMLESARRDKKFARVIADDDGTYDLEKLSDYMEVLISKTAAIRGTDIDKIDSKFAERLIKEAKRDFERIEIPEGPVDIDDYMYTSTESVKAYFKEAGLEESKIEPDSVDSFTDPFSADLDDYFAQAFEEAPEYFVEPEVSKEDVQEIDEAEPSEIDVADIPITGQTDSKEEIEVTDVKPPITEEPEYEAPTIETEKTWLQKMQDSRNPFARTIAMGLARFMNRGSKKALAEPQMQAEATAKRKTFDDEGKKGYGIDDIGVVPLGKAIQSTILRFARGVNDFFRRGKKEDVEPKIVNMPYRQSTETISRFRVKISDADQIAIGRQAKEKQKIIPKVVKTVSAGNDQRTDDDEPTI